MNSNTNINTYFGAKWNIEVCKSGEDGIKSHFPLGEKMKNNMILDHWLEGLIYLFSPSGGALKPHLQNGGLSFAKITKGTMHIGAGNVLPIYSQTGLQIPIKSTSYIRPFFNECTGIYYPESGMALFSRKYDFPIEDKTVTYSEAGFRPDIANSLPTGKINYLWSRFLFTAETGVPGYLYAISGDSITGMNYSGVFINDEKYDLQQSNSPNYNGFSGLPSFELGWRYVWPEDQGMFLLNETGNTTGFIYSPTNITQLVTGFVSGYLSGENFYPFSFNQYPNELSGFSGVYIQDSEVQTLYFPSGVAFNQFDNFTGRYFNVNSGFIYSGFNVGFSTYGSGFYATQGEFTGSMTGIIGSRNILKLDGYITGLIGYKNILNPITLTTGEFLKLKYDTYMQIPAIVNPINVTGENITHGEFNGSGQMKLIGDFQQIFGSINGDGLVSDGNGAWWPIHKTLYKNQIGVTNTNPPQPNAHLSAIMIASGYSNNAFPQINTCPPIISLILNDELAGTSYRIGYCGDDEYFEGEVYSSAGLRLAPPWPYYAYNTLYVNNYTAHNRPSAVWPKKLDIHMIFPGAYPNQDSGINGFAIVKASEGRVSNGRTIIDTQGDVFSSTQHIKPTIYENITAYETCGLEKKYSTWYYKFDNPQMKYEDQIINLYLTFSMDRIAV